MKISIQFLTLPLALAFFCDAGAAEPLVIATPPAAAVRDLCRTADGEIRHYGRRAEQGKMRRVYIASRDEGRSWTECAAAEGDVGAMVKSPYGGDWLYWRLAKGGKVQLLRSKIGPGDTTPQVIDYPWTNLELRQMVAMRSRSRWIA